MGQFIVTLILVLIVFGIFRRVFWGNCVDIIMDIVRISPENSLVHQTTQVFFVRGLFSYMFIAKLFWDVCWQFNIIGMFFGILFCHEKGIGLNCIDCVLQQRTKTLIQQYVPKNKRRMPI